MKNSRYRETSQPNITSIELLTSNQPTIFSVSNTSDRLTHNIWQFMNFFCYLYTNSCLSSYHNLPLAGNELQLMLHHRVFLYLVFVFSFDLCFFALLSASLKRMQTNKSAAVRSIVAVEQAEKEQGEDGQGERACQQLLAFCCCFVY